MVAAEITNSSTDFSQLDPMVSATLDELERAGISQRPEVIAADAGYWNEHHTTRASPGFSEEAGSRSEPSGAYT